MSRREKRGIDANHSVAADHHVKHRSLRRTNHLSNEDEALWQFTANSVDPLMRAKPRVPSQAELIEPTRSKYRPEPLVRPRVAAIGHDRSAVTPSSAKPTPAPHPQPPRPTKAPPLADFEKKKARRIATGRHDIDARIDLHGMRQSEAHVQLRGFLLSCAARGLGTVLVITGKGAPGHPEHLLADMMDTRDRGVLRRSVPRWLEEPDLRTVVVSFREAHVRHGGSGALYVQLRKRKF